MFTFPTHGASDDEWYEYAQQSCDFLKHHLADFLVERFSYKPRYVKQMLSRTGSTISAFTRKQQQQADADTYDLMAESACSDFRIIVEKTVEFILLADVVGRFRRDINTRGKLQNIAKVTTVDCDLIDDFMTRYSVFEHAQADEMPTVPLELDEFEKDVTTLSSWITEFQSRAA